MKKIYTNSFGTEFLEFSDSSGPLFAEVATRASLDSAFLQLYSVLPNPDPVLKKTGNTIVILDEVKRDPHVSSCSTSREAGTMARKWKVVRERASEKAAQAIEDILKNLKLRQVMREILEAWGYGYQVCEVVWERDGNLLIPARLAGKPQRYFMFGMESDLRRKKDAFDTVGVEVEPYKFLATQYRASYDNPYGEAQYSLCYWPVIFKKGGLKMEARFLEKFGTPHVYGKLPRNANAEEKSQLLAALKKMVQDAVATIPDDVSIVIKEATGVSGSSDAFDRYKKYHDSQISTVILGHTAAVDSTPGKLGNEGMALEARKDIIDSDCDMIADTINRLIAWVHELNPTLGKERPVFSLYEETDVDTDRAERDQKLLSTGQVRLTKKYFTKRYDYEDEDIEVVEPASQLPGPQFSVAPYADGQAEIDALADGLPKELLQSQIEEVLKPVLKLVELSSSFDEVRDGVAKLYPKLDTSGVEQTIEKALLLGTVWGKLQKNV